MIGGTVTLALIVALPLLAVAGSSEQTTAEPANGTFHPAEAPEAVGPDGATRFPTALPAMEAGSWVLSLDLGSLQWPCHDCRECETPEGHPGHELVDRDWPWDPRNGWHLDDCWPNTCTVHPWCRPEAVAEGPGQGSQNPWETVEAIKNATPAELMALVAKYPEAVRINGHRGALQFIGCGGESVVASYGVTSVPSLQALLQ